jgi:hypothetical protein
VGGVCASVCSTAQASLCNGACTNITTDVNNCGGCGNACPTGQPCVQGFCGGISCADPNAPTQCAAVFAGGGATDECTNLMTDPFNCSLCGEICPSGGVCVSGLCDTCLGKLNCNDSCIDRTSDANNCNGCGNTCPNGETCQAGTCPGVVCNDPNTPNLCNNNQCVNLFGDDAKNCGACGNPCTAPETCQRGHCALPSTLCTDISTPDQCGSTCTNLLTDSQNCLSAGGCGHHCPSGSNCEEGLCTPPGTSGPWVCNDQFTDILGSHDNCGGCGNTCPIDQVCTAGTCPGIVCNDPNTPNVCNGDQCVNFQTSQDNCGGCGPTFACTSGQLCDGGHCAPTPTATPTPTNPDLSGTYFLSGEANEAPVMGCGSYTVAVSGTFQVSPAGAPDWLISGSLTAVDLSPAPPGCVDYAGPLHCNFSAGTTGLILSGFVNLSCSQPGKIFPTNDIDFSCFLNGTSCSGQLSLLTDTNIGWGGGTADLTRQ